jgi:hypothetical protein
MTVALEGLGVSDTGRHGVTIRIRQTTGENVYSRMTKKFEIGPRHHEEIVVLAT